MTTAKQSEHRYMGDWDCSCGFKGHRQQVIDHMNSFRPGPQVTAKQPYKRPHPPAGLRVRVWLNVDLEQQFRAYCEAHGLTHGQAGRKAVEAMLKR